MINELNLINNIDILFNNKIVLYGAGNIGKSTLEELRSLGVHPTCFCDSDYYKSLGEGIDGLKVISPENLKEIDLKENIAIIITSIHIGFIEQIINILESLKLRTDNIFTFIGLKLSILQNIDSNRLNEAGRAYVAIKESLYSAFSYNMFDANRVLYMKKYFHEENDVFIYAPGKVGTETLYKSIPEAGIKCGKSHCLSDRILKYTLDVNKEIVLKSLEKHRIVNCKESIKLITLVREPLSWAFSNIFQHMELFGFGDYLLSDKSVLEACNAIIEDTIENRNHIRDELFVWFDNEIKYMFGIDIFAHKFDREKGYSIIKQNNIELLVIKLEKLNSLETVIAEFINAPQFKLINNNEANKKSYKYLYNNIREIIKIPRKLINKYYNNNTRMNHFYTEEEKSGFLMKWEKNIYD